jgi:hypothetical protein
VPLGDCERCVWARSMCAVTPADWRWTTPLRRCRIARRVPGTAERLVRCTASSMTLTCACS